MKIEEIFPTKAKIIEIFLTDNYLVAEKNVKMLKRPRWSLH